MEWKYMLILCVILGLTLSVSVFADSPSVDISITGGADEYFVTGDTNSTDLWDSLDTPADINLTDLGDVDESSPNDDELLSWDDTAKQWVARAVAGITDTDTNATTECSTDEVLDGDGDCVSFYNFTATSLFYNMTAALDLYNYTATSLFYNMSDTLWFYNQTHTADLYNYTATDLFYNMSDTLWFYNQTVLDTTIADTDTNYSTACSSGEYGDGSGACINFNDSVTTLFSNEQVVYNATSIATVTGTLDSGNLTSVTILGEGDSYNVSEVTGTPGFDIYINFTGIDNFNTVALRGRYNGGAGHTIAFEIYRTGVGWEERAEITDQMDWGVTTFPVFIGSNFIDGGLVQLRLNHDDSGISNHDYFLDAIFIGQVPGLVSGGDLADLTGRDNACVLLPDVFCKDGSKNMTGNLHLGLYNITNVDKIHAYDWTNATFILAQISDSYNYTATEYFYNMSDTLWFYNMTVTADLYNYTATDLFYNMSNTLWFYNQTVLDTTIADTSAYINCSTNQVYLGNGSCSAFYNMTVTADLYNYTATDLFYNMSNTLWFYNQTVTADLYNYTATSLFYNQSIGYVADTGDSITGNVNMTDNNITSVDCIYFTSGGSWCSA